MKLNILFPCILFVLYSCSPDPKHDKHNEVLSKKNSSTVSNGDPKNLHDLYNDFGLLSKKKEPFFKDTIYNFEYRSNPYRTGLGILDSDTLIVLGSDESWTEYIERIKCQINWAGLSDSSILKFARYFIAGYEGAFDSWGKAAKKKLEQRNKERRLMAKKNGDHVLLEFNTACKVKRTAFRLKIDYDFHSDILKMDTLSKVTKYKIIPML